jgi:hypothetical protein
MLTRLLAVVTLICSSAGFALAQRNETASSIASPQAVTADPSASARTERLPDPANKGGPRRPLIKPEGDWQTDTDAACFAIRSYRVVRDSPQSDTTHFGGYTTCVPAARFRMYTATFRQGEDSR